MARAEVESAPAADNAGSSNVNDNSIEEGEETVFLKTKKVLQDICTGSKACAQLVKELDKKSQAAQIPGAYGLDFLEMKNHQLLDYLIGLSGVVLTKSVGKSIVGSPFIDQLVEARTVLEKIRPIDQKLKYQVDKLVKTAVEGKVESDPLRFKANPDNLEGRGQDSSEDSDADEEDVKKDPSKSGIYRPPRVAPQHFDDKDNDPAKSAEKIKRKSINRALIRELQEEFLETPVEIHNMGDAYAKQLSRETRDKQRFEETYMTRLPMTKRDKHNEGKMSTLGVLGDELTDFSRKRGPAPESSKSKKRKSGGKAKGGKKRFRK